jgi:hypothetical protein
MGEKRNAYTDLKRRALGRTGQSWDMILKGKGTSYREFLDCIKLKNTQN